jgi:hypothetical protein
MAWAEQVLSDRHRELARRVYAAEPLLCRAIVLRQRTSALYWSQFDAAVWGQLRELHEFQAGVIGVSARSGPAPWKVVFRFVRGELKAWAGHEKS